MSSERTDTTMSLDLILVFFCQFLVVCCFSSGCGGPGEQPIESHSPSNDRPALEPQLQDGDLANSPSEARNDMMRAKDLIVAGDEERIADAFFESQCADFFTVDWREYDDEIIALCESVIRTGKLSAEWRGEDLFIRYRDSEERVPLTESEGDRHITVCSLNDLFASDYEVRFIVVSHGSDTMGFCVLPKDEWDDLDRSHPDVVQENFLDPRELPNIVTELTDATLPPAARARFERMLLRYKNNP